MTRLLAFPICLVFLVAFGCGDEGETVSPTAQLEPGGSIAAAPPNEEFPTPDLAPNFVMEDDLQMFRFFPDTERTFEIWMAAACNGVDDDCDGSGDEDIEIEGTLKLHEFNYTAFVSAAASHTRDESGQLHLSVKGTVFDGVKNKDGSIGAGAEIGLFTFNGAASIPDAGPPDLALPPKPDPPDLGDDGRPNPPDRPAPGPGDAFGGGGMNLFTGTIQVDVIDILVFGFGSFAYNGDGGCQVRLSVVNLNNLDDWIEIHASLTKAP